MKKTNSLITLVKTPKIIDNCSLYFAQNPDHIPFDIKRVFYITDANTKLPRGFHAHKKTKQVIFCIQGTIKLVVDNGKERSQVLLNQPNVGVFLDKMIWLEMHNFKKDTILLVLASEKFNPGDYIREYGEFKKRAKKIS